MALEIVADEAWTHRGDEIGRYWCFYGALFGQESALDRLETALRAIKLRHGHKAEVKWKSLNATNDALYRDLIDCTFAHVDSAAVQFRQLFYDRAWVRVTTASGEEELSELDVQFRLCYQFLKHAFGLKCLPINTQVFVRLDTHSSEKHKDALERYATRIPESLGRRDLSLKLTYHNSSKMMRIQMVDLIIGAAGYHGNRLADRRQPGQRGQTPKQKLKQAYAKHVYSWLRKISNAERGANAFMWFESTGRCGIPDDRLMKRIHIWKFKPSAYRVDKGWQNDHLNNQGRYQGPDMTPSIFST